MRIAENVSKPKKVKENTLIGQYAGFISRFVAIVIDLIIIIAVLIILTGTVRLLIDFFNLQRLINTLLNNIPGLQNILSFLAVFTSVTFVFFAYTVFLWLFTGGLTIGKAVMGVRIVRMDGRRLTFWRAVLRYIMFWISVIPLGLGLIWVLWDDERRGWHDKVAKTCVIYNWEAREDVHLLRGIRKRLEELYKTRDRMRKRLGDGDDSEPSEEPALLADSLLEESFPTNPTESQ